MKNYHEKGFTIIELMLSTVVFSIVLLMCMAGIMQITRLYYRGVTQTSTQETARAIASELSDAVQFSNSKILVPTDASGKVVNPKGPRINFTINNNDPTAGKVDAGFICVGGKRYSYALDRQLRFDDPSSNKRLKQRSTVLWVDQPSTGCADAAGNVQRLDLTNRSDVEATGGTELLEENMRLTKLEVVPLTVNTAADIDSNVWNISVSVAYGDEDLLELNEDGTRVRCKPSGPGIEFCATSEISTTVRRRVE